MDPLAEAGKGCSTFDTALYPRQWEFMKGASWRGLHGGGVGIAGAAGDVTGSMPIS
jgi:hypothetical protein